MKIGAWILMVMAFAMITLSAYGGNQVMGEIEFQGKSKIEKTSGVWVDGQYVGYLKELKGSKKVLLLPGEHVITVRQDGYQDFVERVQLQPGDKKVVRVEVRKAPTGAMPAETAQVKLAVNPTRAAVFVDGLFVGHVAEFQGMGRGMLVAPGLHTVKVALPGYQSFETRINPLAGQKVELKTDLLKSRWITEDPIINSAQQRTSAAPSGAAPPLPQMP